MAITILRMVSDCAARAAAELSPETRVDAVRERIETGNARALLAGADLVLDGSDTFDTRVAVAEACDALGVPLVWGVVQLCLTPRRVRAIGYAQAPTELWLRKGLFFRTVTVVPYGRMQYVDVSVGPLERAFGICTLKLHTASPATNASLPGLPTEEGTRLREQLSARGEARLAGL